MIKIKIDKIPIITNPQLTDIVIAEVQKGLAANLDWLDHAFGRSQKLVKQIDTTKYYTPNVYAGVKNYIDVSPSNDLGNYSFFVIDDPQYVDWQPRVPGDITVSYSLIVWCNIDKITGAENRNTEFVKSEILKALNKTFLKSGRLTVNKIFEQAENVYKGFTLDEISNQFMMHPYYAFRLVGEIKTNESCYNN